MASALLCMVRIGQCLWSHAAERIAIRTRFMAVLPHVNPESPTSPWEFQGVHMLMGTDQGAAWKKGEPRESRIVFIGKHLPRDVIVEGLEQCLVGASSKVMPREPAWLK